MAKDKDGNEIVETPAAPAKVVPENIITPDDPPPAPVRKSKAESAPLDLTPVIEAVNNLDKKVNDILEGTKSKHKDVGVLEDLDRMMGFHP